ncbi:type VI secretion system contractile sheath large subunit [Marinobacter sp. chi1]|uniref:Type VI secretion system contractile sheath large subunit n=1 Tax=Marinobacter suaedae TaxID=3057675 RepID=A0ABT8VW19_9GAMM|nr:type VI secretion system contractile sheath large subunit [Marinobacter sp. chi1]MDO3720178.1 type VI secretion system contractile sheath large subunit [Marinobacter sp. chi1]
MKRSQHMTQQGELDIDRLTTNRARAALAIKLIDEKIQGLLNEIIHHSKFQQLEGAWRSLHLLCAESALSPKVRIRMLDASWQDITKDISSTVEFDQTTLFRLVYTQEFGTPGGIPFGLLVGHYEVKHRSSHGRNDVETLRGIAEVSAAAFAPFLCNAAPGLFGIDAFSELYRLRDLAEIFDLKEYEHWNRSLRNLSDSRFIGICMPRVLLRRRYTRRQCAEKHLSFEECPSQHSGNNLCWGYASFAFAAILIREFIRVGWFSHIRGAPRDSSHGGVVNQLPYPAVSSDADTAFEINTDVRITETQEKKLSELGLIALHQSYAAQQSVFLSNPSIHRPPTSPNKISTANANVGSMLQQILCASRFAHHIKLMIRDKIGSLFTAEECQQLLEHWLKKYTSGRSDLDWEGRARRPLKAYRVQVNERPDSTGHFICHIDLQPHYHAEHILSELKLTTELVQMNATS